MLHTCGEKFDDVLRTKRFTAAELQDVVVDVSHLTYLACLFFLSRHADSRAEVVVMEILHGGHEGEREAGKDPV